MIKLCRPVLMCVVAVLLFYSQDGNASPEKYWYGRIQIIDRIDGFYSAKCGEKSRYEGSVSYDEHFVGVLDIGVCGRGMHLGPYNIFSNANYSRTDSYVLVEKRTQCSDDRMKHVRWETPGNKKQQSRNYSIGNMDRSGGNGMVNLMQAPGGMAKLMVVVRPMAYEVMIGGFDLDENKCMDDPPKQVPINLKQSVPWTVGFTLDVTIKDGVIQGSKDIEQSRSDARSRAISRRGMDEDQPGQLVHTLHVNYCFWQESPCDRIQDEFWDDLALMKAYSNDALVSRAHEGNWSLRDYRKAVRDDALAFKNQTNPRKPMACESLFQDINSGSNMPVSSGDMSYSVTDDTIHNMDGSQQRIDQKCMDPVRYQSILRHEEEHRKQAHDTGNPMPDSPTIDSLHTCEPPAYAAGIEVLLNWMQQNCPDAYGDLLSAYQQVRNGF